MKPKKQKQVKIEDLWKYSEAGTIPQPTPEEWQRIKFRYELRIAATCYLKMITIKDIERNAKKEYDNAFQYSADYRNGWNTTCEPWRKYHFISCQLLKMDEFERFGSLDMIQFQHD